MLTFIIVLLIAATIATFFLIKKGKIADVNNNNIPDVIETKVEAIVADIKEEIKKAKKSAPKSSVVKTSAKKVVKKSK
jgi:hypothetical protein